MQTSTHALEVQTHDGTADCLLCAPAAHGTWPAVLVWPDIRGLRPAMQAIASRLAAQGFAVLVPNPFYRIKPAPMPDWTPDFTTADGRQKAMSLITDLTPERVTADAKALIAALDRRPEVDTTRKLGVQGYCMGGALAFRTAAALPQRVGALASFHGGSLVTAAPDSPHRLIPTMQAQALVAVAQDDDTKDPAARPTLIDIFRSADRPALVELFNANHGWCVPDSHAYNQPEAERAWTNLLELYGRTLQ